MRETISFCLDDCDFLLALQRATAAFYDDRPPPLRHLLHTLRIGQSITKGCDEKECMLNKV